jgi:hypothetical protein
MYVMAKESSSENMPLMAARIPAESDALSRPLQTELVWNCLDLDKPDGGVMGESEGGESGDDSCLKAETLCWYKCDSRS